MQIAKLAKALSTLRRKHRLSVNQLAKLTGLSRRTLARIESRSYTGHGTPATGHQPSPRTAFKLARVLLGEEATQRRLDDYTRLSRFYGKDPPFKLLDLLYHYPAFLFHDSPGQAALREEFGADYRHSLDLLLRSGFGTRNLGARLRAWRMQHDLTLVETAALLGLSKSELHRLERAERQPSPRTRYRILRLLTLPQLEGHGFSRAGTAPLLLGEQPAGSRRTRRLGRAGTCTERLTCLKALLSLPPPDSSDSPLHRLRQLWLACPVKGGAGSLKTSDLAARLGISQPHLIRLLRGDRCPSRALREKLAALAESRPLA